MSTITVSLTQRQLNYIYNILSDPEYVSPDPFTRRITTKLAKASSLAKAKTSTT